VKGREPPNFFAAFGDRDVGFLCFPTLLRRQAPGCNEQGGVNAPSKAPGEKFKPLALGRRVAGLMKFHLYGDAAMFISRVAYSTTDEIDATFISLVSTLVNPGVVRIRNTEKLQDVDLEGVTAGAIRGNFFLGAGIDIDRGLCLRSGLNNLSAALRDAPTWIGGIVWMNVTRADGDTIDEEPKTGSPLLGKGQASWLEDSFERPIYVRGPSLATLLDDLSERESDLVVS
jgi:hypothetical protein